MMPTTGQLVLYMDVDGVLFQMQAMGRSPNLRPGVSDFLNWCDQRFACRWLTSWNEKDIQQLCHLIYAPCGARWPWVPWNACKSDSICFNDDLLWLDDAPTDQDYENFQMFRRTGRLQEILTVDPRSVGALIGVRRTLADFLAVYAKQEGRHAA